MNPVQFNIILGAFTMLGFLFSQQNFLPAVPLYVTGIFSLLLYVAEYWAFVFKLKIARLRMLEQLTGGNPNLRVGERTEPGCMLFYAFLMRFVFRILLGMIALVGLSGGELNQELNTFQMIMMFVIVLFELFNMMYSLFETRIFKIAGKRDETDEEIAEYWEKEKRWRAKNFPLLKLPVTVRKDWLASAVLLVMAFVMTHLFWDASNNEFRDFIIRTAKNGESVTFAVAAVLISCFVLCLFFLMPVRLAFWVIERMNADEKPEIRRYRLSLVFAGISICSPTLIQLFASFVFS